MSHEIKPIEHHFAGDSIIFGPWTVKKDGSDKDISDDELKWYLFEGEYDNDPSDAVLSLDEEGVTESEPEDGTYDEGMWQVKVAEGVTEDLAGETYYQRPVVDPPGDSKLTWIGEVEIRE